MIYHSTYKQSLGEYVAKELNGVEKDIFYMLFNGYGMKQKLQSMFFQLCRVGDSKYTMIVQKYVDGNWTVKFYKNKHAQQN